MITKNTHFTLIDTLLHENEFLFVPFHNFLYIKVLLYYGARGGNDIKMFISSLSSLISPKEGNKILKIS